MNFREGTRRLALLLGALGIIVGGFASYAELQTVLSQRARHNRFEQLASSGAVQQERKCRLAGFMSGCSDLPAGWSIKPPIDLSAGLVPKKPGQVDYDALAKKHGGTSDRPDFIPDGASQTNGVSLDWSKSIPLPSEVSKGGIETINWSHDYGVASIETADGQTLYPTAAPSAWFYLLIALFPILGFFIPWGAIRALGWVGAGFVASSK